MENGKQAVAVPLQIMVDIQLGPDGYPWVRMQLSSTAISTSIVFPSDSAEDVIANFTEGIRRAVKGATKKQADTVIPDFTGIKVQE